MTLAFLNGRVLTPQGLVERSVVIVDGGRVTQVCAANDAPAEAEKVDLGGGTLVPGFIDVQVNGGAGVLFNEHPTVDAIEAIGAAHRRFGTTGFLPTLISDDLDVVARAIDAVHTAIERPVPGVLGIHIEGPFLNAARSGIHDARKFRVLDDDAIALLSSLGVGRTLVTLAPERTTPAMISRLTAAGVVASAGHTNATYEEMRAALAAGVTGFTHLFNAMSPLAARAPGVVGAALEDQASWCGLIVDGRHVDPAVLRIALRCKPLAKFMLVSDAMPTVGAARKSFELQGRTITVKDGVCVAADGTLAGSDLDMAQALRNAMDLMNLKFEDAAAMASRNAAQFLGLNDLGRIEPGARASFALLNVAREVMCCWIDGVAYPISHDLA